MKYVYSRGLNLLSALVFSVVPLLAQAQDTIIHYTQTTGFNHGTAAVSLALFQQIGQEQNFVVLQASDGSLFNKPTLAQAKVVVFSNTSGSSGLNLEQRAALEWFVDTLGRHLLGIHAASDTYRHSSANGPNTGVWDWYAETLGGSVQNNPNHTSQNHVDTIYLIQEHPSADNIDFPWIKEEEYYYWQNGYLNSDIEIILEVGQTGNNSWDQQRPVAWYRTNPQGSKVYYTSLGHKLSNFTGAFPEFEQLLRDAMAWLLQGCPLGVTALEAAICAGESYEFGDQALTDAGMYAITYQDAAGCDSTVQLTLTVHPPDFTNDSAEICVGESFLFGGEELTDAGLYSATFQNLSGCDSTVLLALAVLPVDTIFLTVQICAGGSFPFDGESLTEAGDYMAVFQNIQGCDSVVLVELLVLPADTAQLSASICAGDSFLFGGEALTEPGSYSTTVQNAAGCDSVLVLELSVSPADMVAMTVTICEGESYVFGTEALTQPGTYSTTFQTTAGCDSIVQLTLEVAPEVVTTLSTEICEGQAYIISGEELTESGSYAFTFPSAAGCDSTVRLALTVLPSDMVMADAAICAGESYLFGGEELTAAGTYSFTFQNEADCDSIVQLTLAVLPPDTAAISAEICQGGSYVFEGQTLTAAGTYPFGFQNAAGCDSVVLLTLAVLPPDTAAISAEICQGESYAFGGQTLTAAGIYPFNFPNAAGCDSIVMLTLEVRPLFSSAVMASICQGESYEFGGQDLTAAGSYTFTFQSTTGCDSIVSLTLSVFSVNVDVAQDGPTLTAAAADAAYQWVDCDDDDAPIAGATGQSFTPITGGNYAVLVTTPQGCTARSDCFEVMLINTSESNELSGITVYPNPAVSRLVVDFPILLPEVQVAVYTLEGKKLWERRLAQVEGPLEISLDGWAAGVYLLRASSLPLGADTSWKFIKN